MCTRTQQALLSRTNTAPVVVPQSGDNSMPVELQYIAAGADGGFCKGDGLKALLVEIAELWYARYSGEL